MAGFTILFREMWRSNMILCIDIGNTHSVIGVFLKGELLREWRIQSEREKTPDELAVQLMNLFSLHSLSVRECTKVMIGSVVPELTRTFLEFVKKYLNLVPTIVDHNSIKGMPILIDHPSSLGADRILNAYGAKKYYGAPAVIVDFGTATTFDVLNQNGEYQGGIISPGMQLSLRALSEKAALLPRIDLRPPERIIGRNTIEAMQAGTFSAYLCMVEGVLKKIENELNYPFKVIATGGLSTLIAEYSECINIVDHSLTLKALHSLAEDAFE